MDDIQTYLYIIIGIIYLLAQALRRRKKPPVPPQTDIDERSREATDTAQPTPERKKPLSFEELIREISGEAVEVQEPPKEEPLAPSSRPLVSDSEAQSTYQRSIEQAKKLKKKTKDLPRETKSGLFSEYEIEEEGNPFAEEIAANLKNNYDIKKAIVINEILTRKYD